MSKNNTVLKKEIIKGLSKKNKIIPSKFHYDHKGSKLFKLITKQKEYYPTRKEIEILRTIKNEISKIFKEDLSYCEIGSGAIDKIKILMNKKVKFYVPLDISSEFILKESKKLKKIYPNLKIKPIIADYNNVFKVPKLKNTTKIFFFLGSSIGNFHSGDDLKFLKNIKKSMGKNSYIFIGVDLIKKASITKRAYNDKAGYTAQFSLNLINILNKNFNTSLNINDFFYSGEYNKRLKSVQGFLISRINQSFKLGSKAFYLNKNEKIQVEVSNKFSLLSFSNLVKKAHFKVHSYWTDKQKYFSLFLLKS